MALELTLAGRYGGTGILALSGNGEKRTNVSVSIRSDNTSETVAMLRDVIEYLGAGSDTRTDEEDWQARAEQTDPSVDYRAMWWKAEKERETAEQERDEARQERDSWRAQVPLADWEKELVQAAEQPRTLAADDITDEMITRGANILRDAVAVGEIAKSELTRRYAVIDILTAALTEPTRPEGAEDIETDLRPLDLGGVATPGQVADHLASMGYRKSRAVGRDAR